MFALLQLMPYSTKLLGYFLSLLFFSREHNNLRLFKLHIMSGYNNSFWVYCLELEAQKFYLVVGPVCVCVCVEWRGGLQACAHAHLNK